jgi:hypothetical protein
MMWFDEGGEPVRAMDAPPRVGEIMHVRGYAGMSLWMIERQLSWRGSNELKNQEDTKWKKDIGKKHHSEQHGISHTGEQRTSRLQRMHNRLSKKW